jgi:hypothetical protein
MNNNNTTIQKISWKTRFLDDDDPLAPDRPRRGFGGSRRMSQNVVVCRDTIFDMFWRAQPGALNSAVKKLLIQK